MEGSKLTAEWYDSPRYPHFIYADEESVESVINGHEKPSTTAWQSGYFFKVVYTEMVMIGEQNRIDNIKSKEERAKR